MLTIVEKVIFLQEVDIFEHTSTENLAHIAAITDEVEFKADSIIYRENDIPDSMYLVIDGKVRFHRGNKEIVPVKQKDVFGTWALFDDEPRVVTATTLEDSRLLKIEREDFFDLLADHVQITQSILKAVTRRLRSLISRIGIEPTEKPAA